MVKVNCSVCGTAIRRTGKQADKKYHFCSNECRSKYVSQNFILLFRGNANRTFQHQLKAYAQQYRICKHKQEEKVKEKMIQQIMKSSEQGIREGLLVTKFRYLLSPNEIKAILLNLSINEIIFMKPSKNGKRCFYHKYREVT